MSFYTKEHEFLGEIGLGPTNVGCFMNGMWKASGSEVSSLNPSNKQVQIVHLLNIFADILSLKLD